MLFTRKKQAADGWRLSQDLKQSLACYIKAHYAQPRKPVARDMQEKSCSEMRELRECAAPMPPPACMPMAASRAISLEDMLRQADAGFTETLLKRIDASGKKDSEIYKKALLSKQHFSKIRNNPNYKPTKATAISLALALELSLEETKDLIGRAGYALTNSSKFDLIIRYAIEHGIYDLVQINCMLFEYDQSLLGG